MIADQGHSSRTFGRPGRLLGTACLLIFSLLYFFQDSWLEATSCNCPAPHIVEDRQPKPPHLRTSVDSAAPGCPPLGLASFKDKGESITDIFVKTFKDDHDHFMSALKWHNYFLKGFRRFIIVSEIEHELLTTELVGKVLTKIEFFIHKINVTAIMRGRPVVGYNFQQWVKLD